MRLDDLELNNLLVAGDIIESESGGETEPALVPELDSFGYGVTVLDRYCVLDPEYNRLDRF